MANTGTVSLSAFDAGAPVSADLCRVSGYLIGADGSALAGYRLTLRNQYEPLADGQQTLILKERYTAQADENGFVSFAAYRTAVMRIEIPGRGWDLVREITIPDAATANLLDVLLPYVESSAFDDSSPLAVDLADGRFKIGVTGTLSDGTELDVSAGCTYAIGDDAVLEDVGSGYFRPLTTGSTTVTVTAISLSELSPATDEFGNELVRVNAPTNVIPSPASITVTVS